MCEVLSKSLTLRGYINLRIRRRALPDIPAHRRRRCRRERIRYREDITDGLKNAPAAFVGMLEGRNFGKALVRVTPSA